MAVLEGAEDAFATASGMAAVHGALFALLKAGDHVVAARALFGSCLYICETLLPRFGVEVELRRRHRPRRVARRRSARTPGSSSSSRCRTRPSRSSTSPRWPSWPTRPARVVVVDNVFPTPVFQRCLPLGADVVIYSATKHIDGQGRCLGGIVLGRREFVRGPLETFLKHTGGALSPFNAWVMLKGLETLDLRCRAQAATRAAAGGGAAGAPGADAGHLSRPRRSSAGGAGPAADGDRRHHAVARARRRQGGGVPFPRRIEVSY